MKEPRDTEEAAKRAFLVGIRDENTSADRADSRMRELRGLAGTLGLEVAASEIVHPRENHARFGMGTGKADEIARKAAEAGADCIVFDRELNPSRQKNWEELAKIPVIDRQELIIRIFASRARTREAALQVSLAELVYALPRLQHKYIDLARQRGGSYGTRGAGETRFETDRRKVEQRIHRLEEELEEVKRRRQVRRKKRERAGVPVCALVGYTNAGKSTIFNALSGADVQAEDKLFATLDSTSRRLVLPEGAQILLVDTVGFIRHLPHSLVNAFRSTLEEVNRADLLLNVVDAADPDASAQYETTLSVLRELEAENIPRITVLNKIDKIDKIEAANISAEDILKLYPEGIPVCAVDSRNEGLRELCGRIESALSRAGKCFRFPSERTDLAALLHRSGQVLSENYREDCIEIEARVDERTAGKLKEYQCDGV